MCSRARLARCSSRAEQIVLGPGQAALARARARERVVRAARETVETRRAIPSRPARLVRGDEPGEDLLVDLLARLLSASGRRGTTRNGSSRSDSARSSSRSASRILVSFSM